MTERMERAQERLRALRAARDAQDKERHRLTLERLARVEEENDELRAIGGYAAFLELGRRRGWRK